MNTNIKRAGRDGNREPANELNNDLNISQNTGNVKEESMDGKQYESHSLEEWCKLIHDNAVYHGWWEENRAFPETIALCHSELSEALEEYRNGNALVYEGENGKPEGIAVEMIDCVIRVLDWFGHEGLDVEEIMAIKHNYNKTRSFRHGGKRC